jgi:hypothetical protein
MKIEQQQNHKQLEHPSIKRGKTPLNIHPKNDSN